MSENKTYHEQQTQKNILKLRELLKELPPFAADYFRSVEFTTESRTKLSYATDLKTFFTYIKENNPSYRNTSIRDFKLDILEHIEDYQPLVDRNRETALKLGDWALRMKMVMEWLEKIGYKVKE